MAAGSSAFAKLLNARTKTAAPSAPKQEQLIPAPGLDECMRFLAGHDTDYARELNGVGFSKFDVERGHRLASTAIERWSQWDHVWAFEKTRWYHRQFEEAGIRIDLIARPPKPTKPEPIRELRLEPNGTFVLHYQHLDLEEFNRTRTLAGGIAGRRFVGHGDVTWRIPADGESAKGLRDFCEKAGWSMPADVRERVEQLENAAPKLIAMSRATRPTADFEQQVRDLELKRELWLAQMAGMEYLREVNYVALVADEMGTGKTALTLAAAKLAGCFDRDREDGRYGLLVIVPATLRPNWAREAESVLGMKATVINGTHVQKLAGPIVVVNYDVFWKDSPVHELALAREGLQGFAGVICDESHYLKTPDARRTVGVKELLDHAKELDESGIPFRLLLSGSPILNRVQEFVAPLGMVGLLDHFGGEYRFRGHYCTRDSYVLKELNSKLREVGYLCRLKDHHAFAPDGQFLHINDVPEHAAPVELRQRDQDDDIDKARVEELREHMARYGWELVEGSMKLPPKVRIVHNLPIDNRKEYEYAMRMFQQWLWEQLQDMDGGIDAFRRALRAEVLVRIEKLKQLCVKGKLKSAIRWVEDFLADGDHKLVLFVEHDFPMEAITAHFSGEIVATVTGGQSMDRRQGEIDRFQADPDCRVMVSKLKAGGVGITLTAAADVAFLELGWNPGTHDQAEDRLHRGGQTRSVTAHYLLAEQTIDQTISELIDEKRSTVTAATHGGEVGEDSLLGALLGKVVDGGFMGALAS